ERGDQEELALAAAPAFDDLLGRPPARVVMEHAPPEQSHRGGVGVVELADDDVGHQRSLPATASAAASPLRTQSGMPTPRYAAPASARPGSPAARHPISRTRARWPTAYWRMARRQRSTR